jgi:diadenosine tetraphosphate (Ap4A) HIT family hydrolase
MPCSLCDTLSRAASNPSYIASLSEGLLFLSENQGCPGWCILILKDHHEHLELLPPQRRERFLADVTTVGAALRVAFNPLRLNYACFGNQAPHLHWHIMPRRESDPFPLDPVWSWPPAAQRGQAAPTDRLTMIDTIRQALVSGQ